MIFVQSQKSSYILLHHSTPEIDTYQRTTCNASRAQSGNILLSKNVCIHLACNHTEHGMF